MTRLLLVASIVVLLSACASDSNTTSSDSLSASRTTQVDVLTFAMPDTWQQQEPSSTVRRAQFLLPGDDGDATLIVYYFGEGTAGTVQANLDRWIGQFDGETLSVIQSTINGLEVHEVKITGTYIAQVTPGSDDRHNMPAWAMHAAIINTEVGPYYVKAVGPETTIAAHQQSLDKFVALVTYDANAETPADATH